VQYVKIAQGANSKYQNIINQSLIFNYLRFHGPLYKSQVAEALSISIPAITRALRSLEKGGFVEEIVEQKSRNGRTVNFYAASIRNGFVVGIDLLKNKLGVQMMGANREVTIFDLLRDESAEPNTIAKAVGNTISALVEKGKLKSADDLKAICVGSPGIVDVETGEIRTAIFHRELVGTMIRKALEAEFQKPVFVDNVVKLSVFAEYNKIQHSGLKNMFSIDIGFEVGIGLIIDGHVYRGQRFSAGEIGFMRDGYDETGENFPIYAESLSFIWLCRQVSGNVEERAACENFSARETNLEKLKRLFGRASEGDRVSAAIVSAYLKKLAVLLSNIYVLVDVDAIVISGDICLMPGLDGFINGELRTYISNTCRLVPPPLIRSEYGTNSTLIGACDSAFNLYMVKEFPYLMS